MMKINSYLTTKYTNHKCDLVDLKTNKKSDCKLILNEDITYQTWLGFGGALTESAAYNLTKLDDIKKDEVLKLYFNKLNYNLVRLHLGSSDFSLASYDYLESGKLDYSHDDIYLNKALNKILKINPNVVFLVSPWSPPAYMKDNNERCHGGRLKKEYYIEYANYFVNYLIHLISLGYNVKYLTIQNEPAATQVWSSCLYTPAEEYELAKIINELLIKNSLDIKILVWDHNRDIMVERLSPIYEADIDHIIYGGAIHWYDNEPYNNLKIITEKYPDRHLFHTESCIEGGPHYNYYEGLERYARNIIMNMNNNLEAYIDWNLFLDKDGGPNWVGNYCDAPIMIMDDNSYILEYSFYGIMHLASFIKVGYKRIDIKIDNDHLIYTAFMKDDKIIIVILNQTEDDYVLNYNDNYLINKRSITTLVLEK